MTSYMVEAPGQCPILAATTVGQGALFVSGVTDRDSAQLSATRNKYRKTHTGRWVRFVLLSGRPPGEIWPGT